MSKYGIDVSQHQGTINWDSVKGNIDFAILRLGWIGNKNNHTLDTQFERNYSECKRLGIPVGVYVYCYSSSEETARSGANWTIEKLKGKGLELPVYIDMEDGSIAGLGKDKLSKIVYAFNEKIEAANYWAGVYANRNWFDNYLTTDVKNRFTSWIAHYTSEKDKYKGQYDIWQNSSKGKISGINGNVDTNYMYRDLMTEIKGSNVSHPVKKSVDEVAREVINGEWGNGEERKRKLEAEGYNYEEVQARVNQLLGSKNTGVSYYPACNSKYNSLVDALNSIGVDSSFENRKKIAQKNNVRNYEGTATQNNQLLSKLKAGKLKRV